MRNRGCLYLILGIPFAIVVIIMASNAYPKPESSGPPMTDTAMAAVRDYRECEGGGTLDESVKAAIALTQAQERYVPRFAGNEGADNYKVAYPYKARNGDRKEITFGWHPSNGRVLAEGNEAVAVLDFMKQACRR